VAGTATRILISVTEVRRDIARLLERARESREPVFITQYGYITAVLLAPREYERLREAARLTERRILALLQGP
jgi:prevent-host-death family protein